MAGSGHREGQTARCVAASAIDRATGDRDAVRMVDLDAASDFLTAHARLLDRRRFDVHVRGASPEGALAGLEA
jgi:hypothetical protein